MADRIKITVYAERHIWKQLRHRAIDEDEEYSTLIERAIRMYLDSNEKQQQPTAKDQQKRE